jgi:FkbM family methyltransferase
MTAALSSSPALTARQRIETLLGARRNYLKEVLELTSSSRFVAFYGCGAIFGSIVETWRELIGRNIDFCCDSDSSKWQKVFAGVTCISPAELEKFKDELAVFVTVGDFEPVLNDLTNKKFPCAHLIYKYDLVSSDYLSRENLGAVAAKLEQVRAMLSDEKSRQVFDVTLERLLKSDSAPGLMATVCEGNQYFPPDLIHLTAEESFVEAGAYTGDTVSDFLKRTGGAFDSIHCFELDAVNFKALQETVAPQPRADKIFLYPEGLWNEPKEISYSVEKSQSTIGAGEARGRVVRLDDAIGDARVTFLKMDIEGAELKALEGARNTIVTHRPKLAICVYHHIKDLWEIPLYLKSLIPEYRIFLRHHTKLEYETVCYAIPPEEVMT